MRVKRPLRWVALVVVFALFSFGVWVLFASPWLQVRTIEVSGTQMLTQEQVRAQVQPVLGEPLARVDTTRLAQQVQQLAALGQARVIRHWPHTLQVVVQERTPAARTEEPDPQLVDVQGVAYALASALPAEQRAGLVSVKVTLAAQAPTAQTPGSAPGPSSPDPATADPVVSMPGAPSAPLLLSQQPESLRHARAFAVDVATRARAALQPIALANPQVQVRSVEVVGSQALVVLADGRQVRWGDDTEPEVKAKALAALLQPGAPTAFARAFDVRTPDYPLAQ